MGVKIVVIYNHPPFPRTKLSSLHTRIVSCAALVTCAGCILTSHLMTTDSDRLQPVNLIRNKLQLNRG